MKLIHWLFALCLFTASFDVFLVFQLGGTVRFAQLVMLPVCVGAMAKAAQNGRIEWPVGGTWLLLWCGVQVLFLPAGPDIAFSFRYLMFLFFTVGCFFAVVQLYGRSIYIGSLITTYLWSFVLIAGFGIFQIMTPLLHLGSYFVSQWIVPDRLARVSGFCYEPSYYATYLTTGWIVLVDLRLSKAKLTAARKWRWLTILVGIALFLSTSRTAWLFMSLEGVARSGPKVFSSLRGLGRRWWSGRVTIRVPRWKTVGLLVSGAVLATAGLSALRSVIDLNIFLAGTGINNATAHSVNQRQQDFLETVAVFKEHPFIGRSLGGVSSRLSERHGVPNNGKNHLGFPVIMEILTASGVIGVVPFLLFLWRVPPRRNTFSLAG